MLVIPVFVPHAGCPHACCFCDQKIISGQRAMPSVQDVSETVERYRAAAQRYEEVQLAFYGGSFTAIGEDLQERYLEAARPYLRENGGFLDTLRISTRPDCVGESVIRRLRRFRVSVVELGAQSMEDDVLKASGRGHDARATAEASARLRREGFQLGIQTMTGLPGATEESDRRTAAAVCALRPDFVRIYPTVVIKGTALHKKFLEGAYCPPSLSDSVRLCAELYTMYERAGIPVVRIGLQTSETVCEGGEIAAGPYHSAFGQLVRTELIYRETVEALSRLLKAIGCGFSGHTLELAMPSRRFSDAAGQKRSNLLRLQQEYGFGKVKLRAAEKDGGGEARPVAAAPVPQYDAERKTVRLLFA